MMGMALMLLPPAEILLMIWLADRFGWGLVLLGCLIGFFVGRGLIRWRGQVFYRKAMAAAQRDSLPTDAITGGIAWYVAGVLFMIPGFITDVLALLVLLPPVRRRLLGRFGKLVEGRIIAGGGAMGGGGFAWPPGEGGEIIDIEAEPVPPDVQVLEHKGPPEGGV
jgi:UPF0716 protein FxsA